MSRRSSSRVAKNKIASPKVAIQISKEVKSKKTFRDNNDNNDDNEDDDDNIPKRSIFEDDLEADNKAESRATSKAKALKIQDNEYDNDNNDDNEDDDDNIPKRSIFEDDLEADNKAESRATSKAKALNIQDNEYDNDNDNDIPEEISGKNEETRKLRELHEQMMLPKEKRGKKRKAKPVSDDFSNEELDESVLAMLNDMNENENKKLTENESDEATLKNRINLAERRSRRM
jgi:hypothetical protein